MIALGLSLQVTVPEHHKFAAKSPVDFLTAFMTNLAWPIGDQPACAIFFGVPVFLVARRYFQGRETSPAAAEFILVLALWGWLQAAALAVGRASLAESSRYFDTLSILPITGLAAIFHLGFQWWQSPAFARCPR